MKLIINIAVFTGVALFTGLGSAWYMVEHGSPLTTVALGPWKVWYNEGSITADPYTRARLARSGRLPITSAAALYLVATSDEDGEDMRSACDYRIFIPPIQALWWSLTLYDSDGRLIPNPANRHAFNSRSVLPDVDGTTRVHLAPSARPGYWLPSGENHDLMLVLRIFRPVDVGDVPAGEISPEIRPRIEKVGCS